jgi:hypothetical protein
MFTERSTETWFDFTFQNILYFIDRMQSIFIGYTRTLAMICFVMSVGITCVKLAMSGSQLNKELTKLFMAVVTYFVMIWAFPAIMDQGFKIISDIAHSVTVGADFRLSDGLDSGFYDWVAEQTKPKPNYKTVVDPRFENMTDLEWDPSGMTSRPTITVVEEAAGDRIAEINMLLEMRVTNGNTGLISLNQALRFGYMTVTLIYKSLNINNIVDLAKQFADVLLCLVCILYYFYAFCMAIIQYVTTVVEYHFLMAMGILFIPLLLWEGTKHAYESMIKSMFSIGIKLLCVQVVIYLCMVISVDIIKQMYTEYASAKAFNPEEGLAGMAINTFEFYLNIFVMSLLMKLLTDSGPEFASFLSGGQPRLSYGEFAQAAMAGGAAVGAAAAAGRTVAGTAGNAAAGGLSALAAGGAAASGAAHAEAGAGASKGQQLKAGAQALASSLGRSAVGGIMSAVDSGISGAKNVPGMAQQLGNTLGYGISPAAPISAEGVGRGLSNGIGSKGRNGGSSGGGGMGSDLVSGNYITDRDKLQQLKNSKNANERIQGMKMQHQMNRMYGGTAADQRDNKAGSYSGLRGRFNSMRDSIDGFVAGNSQAAPGTWNQSGAMQNQETAAQNQTAGQQSGGQ